MNLDQHNGTKVERKSELELAVTRTLDAPVSRVWEAWTNADLFRQWWVPKSFGMNLVSCDLDVKVGGHYRLAFQVEDTTMEFFGTYLEVTPPSRLVWTNEEDEGGVTVTTVTFEEANGKTQLTVINQYPSVEALESDGSTEALPETLAQLEELLVILGASAETN